MAILTAIEAKAGQDTRALDRPVAQTWIGIVDVTLAGFGFDKDPVAVICRHIRKSAIDLVAMSSLARVGVTRFFFRNIADTVAQEAKIPVMLVHPDPE